MALKQIILAKQISEKELEINSLREKSADFDIREKQLEKAIEEAKTDEEIKVVDEQVDEFNVLDKFYGRKHIPMDKA